MKTKYLILLLFLLVSFSCEKTESFESKWTKLSNYPGDGEKSMRGIAVAAGNKILVGWGVKNNRLWLYNTQTDTWQIIPKITEAEREGAVTFSYNNLAYIMGGWGTNWDHYENNDLAKKNLKYNAVTKTFEVLNDEDKTYLSKIGIVVNNKVYFLSSFTISYEPDIDVIVLTEYDIKTDTWKKINENAEINPDCEISFGIDNKIYLGKPWTFREGEAEQEFWEYNIETNKWKRLNDYPGPEGRESTGFSINGKGYIMGGIINSDEPVKDIWEYTPETDSWKKIGEIPLKNSLETRAVIIGNAVYFFLSSWSPYEVWKFEP